MTIINLLHVSAMGCHPQEVFQIRGVQAQHANFLRRPIHCPHGNVENINIVKYIKLISKTLQCTFDLKELLMMALWYRNMYEINIWHRLYFIKCLCLCINYKNMQGISDKNVGEKLAMTHILPLLQCSKW